MGSWWRPGSVPVIVMGCRAKSIAIYSKLRIPEFESSGNFEIFFLRLSTTLLPTYCVRKFSMLKTLKLQEL